jgi:hypothetical protein
MAGETGEVSSIGVKLTLDAGQFMGGMKTAQGALNTFQQQAARAGSGAAQLKAGGGKPAASGPSSAQSLTGVDVSLTVNKGQLVQLRTEISRGLGAIPVQISATFPRSGPYSPQAIIGTVFSSMAGVSPAQGRLWGRQAIEQFIPKVPTRAHGGPVQQHRPVLVGERRPEVFVPQTHGRIVPDAERWHREQERMRRREAEIAALEYQQQRRHEREMGAYRGKTVRGYGGKYGSARPGSSRDLFDYQERVWGNAFDTPRGYAYHVTHSLPFIRLGGIQGAGVQPRSHIRDDRHAAGESPWQRGSYWMAGGNPLYMYHDEAAVLRTPSDRRFSGPDRSGVVTTRQAIPRRDLQYWGQDSNWHRFRRGRSRQEGGPVRRDWRLDPSWRDAPRVEHVSVSSLLPYRELDREIHPRFAHDYGYLDELTEKIRAEGFDPKKPVQVWYDPFRHTATVADGNHRLAVARRLGIEKVPTTVQINQYGDRRTKGHRMPGESPVLPDDTGYIPASLPPSWIGLRRRGGIAHAWRGVTARAWKQTLAEGGGTFPVDPSVAVPGRGHAVGISAYLPDAQSFHVPQTDPVAFMRAFHAQKKAGAPYVGTWLNPATGLIDVDPSTVIARKRSADMVLRGGHEKAAYDLGYGETWYASDKGLRAQTSRLMDIVYGRRKAGGGLVHAVAGKRVSPLEAYPFAGLGGPREPVNIKRAMAELYPQAFATLQRNLEAQTPLTVSKGLGWYPEMGDLLERIAGGRNVSPDLLAATTAKFSQNAPWPRNLLSATAFIDQIQKGRFGTGKGTMPSVFAGGTARLSALSLWEKTKTGVYRPKTGVDPFGILAGPKDLPFALALRGEERANAIDRMVNRAAGHTREVATPMERVAVDTAVRKLAGLRGEQVRGTQAIAWYAGGGGELEVPRNWEALWRYLGHRAAGGVAVAGQTHGLVHPGGSFASQVFQTAADWANDPFMAIMAYQSMQQQGQKRARGGFVHAGEGAFANTFKPARLLHRYTPSGFSGPLWDPRVSAMSSSMIDQIRNAQVEHALTFGNKYGEELQGMAIGDSHSVYPMRTEGIPWWLGGRLGLNMGHEYQMNDKGQIIPVSFNILSQLDKRGVHNHPTATMGHEIWRPSTGDIGSMLIEGQAESWVVTPHHTTIMRRDQKMAGYGQDFIFTGPPEKALFKSLLPRIGLSVAEAKKMNPDDLYKVVNSRRVNLDARLWNDILDQMAEMYGFEWEHYIHPREGVYRPTLGLARGGRARVARDFVGLPIPFITPGLLKRDYLFTPGREAERYGQALWPRIAGVPGVMDARLRRQAEEAQERYNFGTIAERWMAGARPGASLPAGRMSWQGLIEKVGQPRPTMMVEPSSPFGSLRPKLKMAAGGPVYGPLTRRILGLPDPPKAPEVPVAEPPKVPEWLRRARESKLPPKIYRQGGGGVSIDPTFNRILKRYQKPIVETLESLSDEYRLPLTLSGALPGDKWIKALPGQGMVAAYTTPWNIRFNPKAIRENLLFGDYMGNIASIMGGEGRSGVEAGKVEGIATHEFGHLLHHSAGIEGMEWIQRNKQGILANPPSKYALASPLDLSAWYVGGNQRRMPGAEAFAELFAAAKLYGEDPFDIMKLVGQRPTDIHVANRNMIKWLEERFGASSHKAGGGRSGEGLYIVGEIGPELFVPNRLAHLIPKKVMDQIPRQASGGIVTIGKRRNELFAPPEDGIIIPNRLMDQVPHRKGGGPTIGPNPMGGEIDPFWSHPRTPEERLVANLSTPQLVQLQPPVAPPAYGVGPGYQPAPITAEQPAPQQPAPETVQAQTVNVTAEGATTVNTRNATAAGAAGAAAARPAAGPAAAGAGAPPPGFARMGRLQYPETMESFVKAIADRGLNEEEIFAALRAQGNKDVSLQEDPAIKERTRQLLTAARSARASIADIGQTMTAWQQVMGGRTPRGTIAQLASMEFGGRRRQYAMQYEAREAQRALQVATKGTTVLTAPSAIGEVGEEIPIEAGLDEYMNLSAKLMGERGKEAEATKAQMKAIAGSSDEMGKVTKAFDAFKEANQKLLPSTGSIVRNLGVIIGATSLYGVAMSAANKGVGIAVDIIGKQIDALTGWNSTSTKVTTGLADQTQAAHGNVQAVISQTAVTAGLSKEAYDYVRTSLATTILIKAGAKAMEETQQLVRASYGAGAGAPSGLYGGTGGLFGTSLFATYMGGTKGFSENVQGTFAGNRPGAQTDLVGDLQRGFDFMANSDYRNTVLGEAKKQGGSPLNPVFDLIGQGGDILRDLDVTGWFRAVFPKSPPTNPMETGVYNPEAGLRPEGLEANRAAMDDLTEAAGRGATQMKDSVPVHWRYAKSVAEEDAAVVAAAKAGDVFGMTMARTSHVIMAVGDDLDETGQKVGKVAKSTEEYKKAMLESAVGKTVAEPQVWADLNVRQIKAQWQATAAQQQRQINVEIPIQTWKSILQQPLLPAGISSIGPLTPARAGMTPGAAGAMGEAMASTTASNVYMAGVAGKGLVEAAKQIFQFNPQSLPDFAMAASQAMAASAAIAKFTLKMTEMNRAASQASWDNQIRLANRSLGDAVGLLTKEQKARLGLNNVSATRLGQLQREQWLISRQSQQLGLQLQQRAITTQLALAQFQAPGETGEERYYRQRQAIAEAGVAQKQLNFSFRDFTISGEIWKINAERAATDASRAIDVMTKARDAELYSIEAQRAIAGAQAKLGVALGNIDAMLNTSRSNWETALSAASQGISNFAGSLEIGVDAIYKSLGYTVSTNRQGEKVYTPGTGPSQYGDQVTVHGGGGTRTPYLPPGYNAEGIVGMTVGPTKMVVGEAKGEAVAVLKNPRMADMAPQTAYGGSANVVVNINGPVVKDQQDISDLAYRVAHEVEKALSRKGQMFGLRSPAV